MPIVPITLRLEDSRGDPLVEKIVSLSNTQDIYADGSLTPYGSKVFAVTNSEGILSTQVKVDELGSLYLVSWDCRKQNVFIPSTGGDLGQQIENGQAAEALEDPLGQLQSYIDLAVSGVAAGGDSLRSGISENSLSSYRVLATVGGFLVYASSDDEDLAFRVVGVSTTAGTAINYRVKGLIEFSGWSWIAGLPVFLGLDGFLTQTLTDQPFTLQIGVALTEKIVDIDIKQPIFRG